MPIIYRCRHCGFVLHIFLRVGQNSYGVPTPSEVAAWYGGLCPRCGRPLGTPSIEDVTVLTRGREKLRQVLERDLEKHNISSTTYTRALRLLEQRAR